MKLGFGIVREITTSFENVPNPKEKANLYCILMENIPRLMNVENWFMNV